MNELFGNQKFIEIKLYYKLEKTKCGQIFPVVIKEEEYNKAKVDEKLKDTVKYVNTSWATATWKKANELLEAATKYNFHLNQNEIDLNLFRKIRLSSLLVSWDVKEDGVPVPCNSEKIDSLHQTIALELLKAYDDATQVSQEDEVKN